MKTWTAKRTGALFAGVFLALTCAAILHAQSAGGFVPLFDGRSLEGWTVENSGPNNFSVQDGVLRVEEREGWIRTNRQFSDFVLRIEFRFVTPGADSGIFLRAATLGGFLRGWPNSSYQVQLREISQPSNLLPVGHIYRHGVPQGETTYDADAVDRVYRAVGEWQSLEIQASGDRLTVALNGTPITTSANIQNATGYIGIQSETGTVEYRSIEIRELN